MRPSFQAELVERGTLYTELGWRGPPRSVQLYRPVGTGFDPISDALSYAHWVAVTGGYPWTRGHQQTGTTCSPPKWACGSPNTATSARFSANPGPGTICSRRVRC